MATPITMRYGRASGTGSGGAPIVVQTVTLDNQNVSASSNATFRIPLDDIDGYTPAGIVGFRAQNATNSGANAARCFFSMCRIIGSTTEGYDYDATAILRNTYTSDAKILLTIDVMYIQNTI